MMVPRFLAVALIGLIPASAFAQSNPGGPSVVAPGARGAVTGTGVPTPITPGVPPASPIPNPTPPPANQVPAAPVMNVPTCVAPGYVGPGGTPNGCPPGTPAHPYSVVPVR